MPARKLHSYLIILLALLTMGNQCAEVDVTDPNVAAAMQELNSAWSQGYKAMLNDIGTKHFNVSRAVAYTGMQKALKNLGFEIVTSEEDYYLNVTIPAAAMFTAQEWQIVRTQEEPGMRSIVSRHLGFKGNLARLEPESLLIEGKITLRTGGNGTDISLTFQLQPVAEQPPESILPRREYPPPYAARVGFEKIWKAYASAVSAASRS